MNRNFLKITIVIFLLPLLLGSVAHKFYVSTTNVEYVKEKQELQIITKIFIDDIEKALRQRYSPSINIATKKETEIDEGYLKKYILQKLKIKVNGKPVSLEYIGKEADLHIVTMYFQIEDISELKSIEIENKVLFEMFTEQQNIIHFKTSNLKKNLLLNKSKPKGELIF